MLNHTYTSVKNANLVDCGKKQHIPSQPTPLLKENFLGEFRTELDKKKVLAALGIATELSLEWGNIKGNIGDSTQLITELDARTKYVSALDGMNKTIGDGIAYLETIIGREEDAEKEQNRLITELDTNFKNLQTEVAKVQKHLTDEVDVNITQLQKELETISKSVENITSLIQVSAQADNALSLLEGENPGLYVPDLSGRVDSLSSDIGTIQKDVQAVKDEYVKREEFGDGDLNFVPKSDYDTFSSSTVDRLDTLETEIKSTVKTGEDGHVATLYVNEISKNNTSENIKLTDSFEMVGDKPIDVRFIRETLEDLLALPVNVCYEGMGVIVNSLSSLYILRKPSEGNLTQEYISNINNWKCPEDLVTVAMTLSEYENLSEKNPNVFYYIYEDEITRTQEPNRADFSDDKSFNVAWQEWVESLKILSQEYMSASWGVDIENKLGQKASTESLNLLIDEINNIKGNGEGPSLNSLGQSIVSLQESDLEILSRIDTILQNTEEGESGRLVDVEYEVSEVKTNLGNYVTKSELQDEAQDFIFVKTSTYTADQKNLQDTLAAQFTTDQLTASNITTDNITLGKTTLSANSENLLIGNSPVALTKDLPKIEVLTSEQYESKKDNLEDDVYYYIYEDETTLATKQELQEAKNKISELEIRIATLEQKFNEEVN